MSPHFGSTWTPSCQLSLGDSSEITQFHVVRNRRKKQRRALSICIELLLIITLTKEDVVVILLFFFVPHTLFSLCLLFEFTLLGIRSISTDCCSSDFCSCKPQWFVLLGLTSRRADLMVVLASRSFHCTFILLALLFACPRVLASRRSDFVVVLAGRSHHRTYCLLWLWS